MAPPKGSSKSSAHTKTSSTKDGKGSSSRPAAITDPRFANIGTDPRFRLPSRKHQKINLDSRFRRLLTDDEFAQKSTVDRYGRRLDAKSGRRALERFYRMDEDELGSDKDSEDEDEEEGKSKAHSKTYDPARQGGFEESSSDESDSSDSSEDDSDLASDVDVDEDNEDVDEEALAQQTAGVEARGEVPEGEVTTRLAVVNMDWDNVRAVDLMAVAQSFCPAGGRPLSCAIYPSEFGQERMEREEIEGPPKALFTEHKRKKKRRKSGSDSESEDDAAMDARIRRELLEGATEESAEIDSRALRAYQLSRLRYFYAVLTFDGKGTAHAVYNAMDGREYLSSANFFDLRFVPDDTSFDDDKPRDECSRIPNGYRPSEFVTEALTHSKVKLTWDADDTERKEVQKRAFGRQEIDDNDLKAYVGSDSSEEESGDEEGVAENENGQNGKGEAEPKLSKAEEARRKMRLALGLPVEEMTSKKSKSGASNEPVMGDMQITFSAGLSSDKAGSKSKNGVFENSLDDVREETTLEKYRRKEKERKARRKEKAKAARNGVEVAPAAPDQEDDLSSPSEAEDMDEIVLDDTGPTNAPDEEEEDPFNDDFFTNPAAANAAARKASKAAKRKAAQEAAAVESAAREKERAQLELLMADDRAQGGVSAAEHFDMAAIRKAEKAGDKKKGKWAKKKQDKRAANGKQEDEAGLQSGFELDTADPRFQGLFDSHEFAIDPGHARFSGTKAMRQLLEEGRRKRKDFVGDDLPVDKNKGTEKRKKGGDIDELVRKVKKRKA